MVGHEQQVLGAGEEPVLVLVLVLLGLVVWLLLLVAGGAQSFSGTWGWVLPPGAAITKYHQLGSLKH